MTRLQQHATRLDSAIDSILRDGPDPISPDEDRLVATARVLRRSLPRLHPSFGFEEHLAARLAAARRMELAPATAVATVPTPIRPDVEVESPEASAVTTEVEAHERRRRNLVAGGAIASGVSLALPIAGAAIVAWRRTRSSGGLF
jgi:hypothetical protein